jgi:phosphatidylglycerol---prolipoprotein diacylglyceryl transferase
VVDPVILPGRSHPPRDRFNRRRSRGIRQVLFEWRGTRIYSYPVMMYVGLTLGLFAGNCVADLAGMNSARVFVATILLAIVGMIGARMMFVATHWAVYRREPQRIWRRSEGGADLLGGVGLAVAVSPPLLAAMAIPLDAFGDVAIFVMLIWLIFGRVGCLLHGCCSGRLSTGWLSLKLSDHNGIACSRIPTQLLEAGLGLVLLGGAAALWNERPFPGALFISVVLVYGVGRFALQSMRDEQDRVYNVNIQQAVCATVIALSVTALLWLWLSQDARP